MREVKIVFQVSDEEAAQLLSRDMVVTPMSDFEAGQLAAALAGVAEVLAMVRKAHATLTEVMEARGKVDPDIQATVAKLHEPLRLGAEQQEYVRVLLGRSARVGRGEDGKEVMQ
jgi:hypothetical protein